MFKAGDEKQIAPRGVDSSRYAADQKRMLDELKKDGLGMDLFASALSPYPFAVSTERLTQWHLLQQSLRKAVHAVVRHFLNDARLQDIIRLSPQELQLLRLVKDKPYCIGGIRPDFLFSISGDTMITEINGRFPINGFLSSVLLNRVMPKLYSGVLPIPELENLPLRVQQRFRHAAEVTVLKSSEPGWDIHLLQQFLRVPVKIRTPQEIRTKGFGQSIVLEMHQHELLQELTDEEMLELTSRADTSNDLRTILIVHDKRFLRLLSTDDILKDYLEKEDIERLKRHIIPTWTKAQAPEVFEEAMESPHWLIKPPRSGKGAGIVVAQSQSPSEWRETLRTLPDDWILQPYVQQKTFPIWRTDGDALVCESMQVVGMLPMLDEDDFGCGMFRAAPDHIVNVARGGVILAPTLQEAFHA